MKGDLQDHDHPEQSPSFSRCHHHGPSTPWLPLQMPVVLLFFCKAHGKVAKQQRPVKLETPRDTNGDIFLVLNAPTQMICSWGREDKPLSRTATIIAFSLFLFFFLFLIKPRGKHQTNKLADNTAICSAKEMALAPGSGDHVLNHAEDQSILFYF